ncbi:Hcp1 family type VI secretion system effector [bacterium SCGC AG-212-C10]|nr:Hcp1 family type VI secretion system effector [bacterium SCGC AG-212-C10]
MASDYLLELDGVKGESADDKHKGAIEIESFSWGVANASSQGRGGGGGSGKASFQDFSFVKREDSSSPLLFLKCATGEHIKKAVLFVRKAGGDQQDYYKVTLEDCIISSFAQAADGEPRGDVPSDSFSLNYSKIEYIHRSSPSDGTVGTEVRASWDLKQNKGA